MLITEQIEQLRERVAAIQHGENPVRAYLEMWDICTKDVPAILDEIERLNADITTLHRAVEIAQEENAALRDKLAQYHCHACRQAAGFEIIDCSGCEWKEMEAPDV